MKFHFVVPGEVKAMSRARTGQGRVYKTGGDRAYQDYIWMCAVKAGMRQDSFPRGIPIWIGIVAYIRKPKRAVHPVYPLGTPDLDNFLKQAMDAIAHGLFNDSQIVGILPSAKLYGDPERLEIEITSDKPAASGPGVGGRY